MPPKVAIHPSVQVAGEGFFAGFSAPWLGWRFMRAHPGLWRYGVIPLLLNLLITAVLLVLLIGTAAYLFSEFHGRAGEGWLWLAARVLVAIVLLAAAVALALLAWVFLQGVLCGHFYGRLAERVERELGLPREEIRSVPWSYQLADTGRDLAFLVGVSAGCLAVQIIPGLGAVLGVTAGYYFHAMTLGMDYFDHPQSLRGWRRSEKHRFAQRHRPCVLGLGTAVLLLALVPVLNAVLLTTSVCGAVLLHRRLATEEHAEPTAPDGPRDPIPEPRP